MGLPNPLEQPAEQGAGLSSYTAPRPIQSSSETIVSHNKQDFRFVVCSQFYYIFSSKSQLTVNGYKHCKKVKFCFKAQSTPLTK